MLSAPSFPAQFGSALAKTMMGDLGAWGVVALRQSSPFISFSARSSSVDGAAVACRDHLKSLRAGANAFFYVAIQRVAGDRGGYRLWIARVGSCSRNSTDLCSYFTLLYFGGHSQNEDFALIGIFSLFSAVSRAAYLGCRRVGLQFGRYDGQSYLHTLGYPFLSSSRAIIWESYHRPALLALGFMDHPLPALGEISALHAPLECMQRGAFAGTCRGGAGERYRCSTHRCGALDCNCAADYEIGITISHARMERRALRKYSGTITHFCWRS